MFEFISDSEIFDTRDKAEKAFFEEKLLFNVSSLNYFSFL